MKTKKRFLSILLSLMLVLVLLPVMSATAGEILSSVYYLDASGTTQSCTTYTEVTDSTTTLDAGWYVVSGNVTCGNINASGKAVHLILCDEATLSASSIDISYGGTMTVYAGSTGEAIQGTGALTVNAQYNAVSTMNGAFTMNGGVVNLSSQYKVFNDGGTIAINGGSFTAFSTGDGVFDENQATVSVASGLTVMAGDSETTAVDVTDTFARSHGQKWVHIDKAVTPVASVTSGSTTTEYTDFDTAVNYWSTTNGATLTLLADVETEKGVNVNSGGGTRIIDLNGYGIRYSGQNKRPVIQNTEVALTLKDSAASARTHYITLDGNGRGVSVADSGTASATCIKVTGGYITGGNTAGGENKSGGGVCAANGDFTMNGGTIVGNTADKGGGVWIGGTNPTLTMNGGTITANAAATSVTADSGGGGVYVNSGSFNMKGGTISGNKANSNGGGIYVNTRGTFNLSSGTISGNTATSYGGGVFNYGTFTMSGNSTIINNKVTGSSGKGGGVSNSSSGQFTMNGGKIQGNEAVYYAGVRIDGGTFTMTDGEISGNKASDAIGGVYVYDCTFTMSGGKIVNNEAASSCGGVYVLAPFNLSGGAVIKDNLMGSEKSNVLVNDGKKITITGALTSDAGIGVTMKTPGIFTTSTDEAKAKDYQKYFTSDNEAYIVMTDGDELKLAEHTHDFTYTADGATITATCSATGCPLTDSKATLTIVKPTLETYGGEGAATATLSGLTDFNAATSKTIAETDIQYVGRKGTTYTESAKAPTNAGDYTAKITVEGKTASVDYTIAKATTSITTAPAASAITYGQTLADSALTGGAASVAGSFAWKDSTVAPAVSDSEKTEYDVVFTPTDANYSTAECKVKLTVNKADAVAATVTANSRTYDGTAQPLVTVSGEPTGGTMQYALGTETEATEEYAASIPTATNAGPYYVWYKAVGDKNHNDTAPVKVDVQIAPKSITGADVKLSETQLTYTGEDQTVTVKGVILDGVELTADDYEVTASASTLTAKDKGEYTVTVTGKGNYADTAAGKWSIVDKAIVLKAEDVKAVYDSKAHGITVTVTDPASGYTVKYGMAEGTYDLDASPEITNVKDSPLKVFYKVTAEDYSDYTGYATVTITKAPQEAPAAPVAAEVKADSVTLTAITGGEYRLGDGDWQSSPAFTGLTANTEYSFTQRLAGDDNHEASPAGEAVKIKTGEGKLETDVVTEQGAPPVTGGNLDEVAQEMITAEEAGQNVKIWVESAPVKEENVPAADQGAAQQAAGKLGGTIGKWFDLSMLKQVNGGETTEIHQTKKAFKFSIPVPEELRLAQKAVTGRTFWLIRIDDGKTETIATTTGDTLEGETNVFTLFAIVYADKETRPEPAGRTRPIVTTYKKNGLTVSWTQMKNVDGYDIFMVECSNQHDVNSHLYKSVSAKKKSVTIKGLRKGTDFKFRVKAYVLKNGKKKYYGDLYTIHGIVGGVSGKYTNVISIKPKQKKLALTEGEEQKAEAKLTLETKGKLPLAHAGGSVAYISNNPKVATVTSEGVVKGVKAGTCTIEMRANSGFYTTMKVTVTKGPDKIFFPKKAYTLKLKKKTLDLKAKLKAEPADATLKLTWKSSDKKIATVDKDGVVTAKKKGEVTITVTAANGRKVKVKVTIK